MTEALHQVAPRRSNAPLNDLDRHTIARLEAMYGARLQPVPKVTPKVAPPVAPKPVVVVSSATKQPSLLRPIAFVMFVLVALLDGALFLVTPEGRNAYDQAAALIAPVADKAHELLVPILGVLTAP